MPRIRTRKSPPKHRPTHRPNEYVLFVQTEEKQEDVAVFTSAEPLKDMQVHMDALGIHPSYDRAVGIRASYVPGTDAKRRALIQSLEHNASHNYGRKKIAGIKEELITLEAAGLEE